MDVIHKGALPIQRRMPRRSFLASLGLGAIAVAFAEIIVAGRARTDSNTTQHFIGATPDSLCLDPLSSLPTPSIQTEIPEFEAIEMVDIAFEPEELTITANTDVVLTIDNKGALQHDIVIDELDVKSDLLDGGASTTVTINAPTGSYEYYCSIPGHKEAGMFGVLTAQDVAMVTDREGTPRLDIGTPSSSGQTLPRQFHGEWGGRVRWFRNISESDAFLVLQLQEGAAGQIVGSVAYNFDGDVVCRGDVIFVGLGETGLLPPSAVVNQNITMGNCANGAEFELVVDGDLMFAELTHPQFNLCPIRGELTKS